MAEPFKPDHIPQLDGLRGIACLLVITAHVSPDIPLLSQNTLPGVYVFFALSGFLITRNLLADRANPHRARDFYVKRCARLMPLFFAMVLIISIISPTREWAHTVLYIGNLDGHFMPHLYHFWSLFVEEQYYLIWPAAIWFLASDDRLAWSLAALSLPVAVISSMAYETVPSVMAHGPSFIHFTTPTNIVALLIGSAIAFRETWWRTGRRLLWLGGALVLISWGIGYFLAHLPEALLTDGPVINALENWAQELVCTGVFCLALSGAWPAFDALCRDRFLRWTGRISYGLYVVQEPILEGIVSVTRHGTRLGMRMENMPQKGLVIAAAVLIGSYSAAWASFTFFEKPIQTKARQWLSRRQNAAGAATH